MSRNAGSVTLRPTAFTSSSSAASVASVTASSRVARYDDTPTHISRLIMSWQYADAGTSNMIQSGRVKVGAGGDVGTATRLITWTVSLRCHSSSAVTARPPISIAHTPSAMYRLRLLAARGATGLRDGATRQFSSLSVGSFCALSRNLSSAGSRSRAGSERRNMIWIGVSPATSSDWHFGHEAYGALPLTS